MHDTIQYLYVKINKVVVMKLLCLKEPKASRDSLNAT